MTDLKSLEFERWSEHTPTKYSPVDQGSVGCLESPSPRRKIPFARWLANTTQSSRLAGESSREIYQSTDAIHPFRHCIRMDLTCEGPASGRSGRQAAAEHHFYPL